MTASVSDMAVSSRREFLKTASVAATGFALGFYLPGPAVGARGAAKDEPVEINAWIHIALNGTITLDVARVEMGQGVTTALPMLLAEELECDWQAVRMRFASPAENLARKNAYVTMITGDSSSVRGSQDYLRRAGAAACQMLRAAAAKRWKADIADCVAANSVVTHMKTGRKLRYGQLAADAAAMPVPMSADLTLKDDARWTCLGQPKARLDIPAKVDGTAQFGIDVRVPGMLYAAIAQSPVFGGKPMAVDSSSVDGTRGIRKVMMIEDFVVVVADNWWRAQQALKKLKITWNNGPNATLDDAGIEALIADGFTKGGKPMARKGDSQQALSTATKVVEAEYFSPFLAHATMEPQNCTARVDGDKVELWAPSQGPDVSLMIAAATAKVPPANVTVHRMYVGGGFGRRGISQDFVRQAVLIAKEVPGVAVKMLWSREEDTQHDFYRPASIVRQRAALDAQGALVGWEARIASPSVLSKLRPQALRDGVDPMAADGLRDMPYGVPNLAVDYALTNTPVPAGFWRAIYHSQNPFARECFLDEVAAAVGRHPVDLRRTLLKDDPELLAVLDAVAGKAPPVPPQPGHGVGYAANAMDDSLVAAAVEVTVSPTKKIRIERAVVGIDCGHVVNPDTIRAQIESCVVFGLSAVLFGEINIREGRVVQRSFTDYRVMALRHMPAVEAIIMPSGGSWGGVGEPPLSVLVPALVNAVAVATGERVRRLPLKNHGYSPA